MGKIIKSTEKYTVKRPDGDMEVTVLIRWSDRRKSQKIITPDGRFVFSFPYWESITEQEVKEIIAANLDDVVAAKNDERFRGFVPLTQQDKKVLTGRTLDEILPFLDTFKYKDLADGFEYRAVWSHRFAGCFWGLRKMIEINPVMLLLPAEMQRYILAHEFTHGLLYLTYSHDRPHGEDFFETAELVMPGFREAHERFKYYHPVVRAYSFLND